ncbi:gamma-glutamyltransferase family protein [Rhizobium metallidurans]|uniref:Gamma-glutamyltranspeptidase/glutathione hydrolase n=1 Tax=Rhizobium metallidurans TaxID=1265931 RepID=A0A7W6GDA7_9HYPH|nr:gamma-glutamyltransferase [Rhizobium metallidurans]MBB3967002.1 gamma-glutamyltranspeptidase/glutathione hydrolase [Rhizobium metallidurans]
MSARWPNLSVFEPDVELAGFRPVMGEHGMVSSPHAGASQIGLDILRQGGNAIDAAIATSAALAVYTPMQCGPGGDAFWLISTADGEVSAMDASGPASRNADPSKLREMGLDSIGARSAYSVTVPGSVDGWAKAAKLFGTRNLTELLEPAARVAESGFVASRHTVASFRIGEEELRANGSLGLWSEDGRLPALYSKIRQPHLADALRRIGKSNGRDLYEGALAQAIVRAVRSAGGWLDEHDLSSYEAEWTVPISLRFGPFEVFTTPPSTQGFSLLATLSRAANLLDRPFDRHDPGTIHALIEAVADGLRLRDLHNSDRRDFQGAPSATWAPEAVKRFETSFNPDERSSTAAAPTRRVTKGDTAHLAVADGKGTVVSLIQSLFFDFGSCIAVAEGGFTLQNRGSAFHLDSEEAGYLSPGRRPPSTLMPTIVLKDDRPVLSLGCMGGDGQMQTQLQVLMDILLGGLDPQQATSRPRWYLDRSSPEGAVVKVEAGVASQVIDGLRARGHHVEILGASEEIMGHAQVIQISHGVFIGAADPRSDGQVHAF